MNISAPFVIFIKCGICLRNSTHEIDDVHSRDAALARYGKVACPHCNIIADALPTDMSFYRRELSGHNPEEGVWCFKCNEFWPGSRSSCPSCSSDYVRTAYKGIGAKIAFHNIFPQP